MVEPIVNAGMVSAEEYERLRRSYAALQDQFDAANEVLSAVGRSAGDAATVLTTIVESARRLCRSDAAHLYLLEDGVYKLIKAVGLSEESIAYIAEHPMPMDRQTLVGRVALDRKTQQIPDVVADPGYGRLDLQRVAGFRTTMGAPMIVDDKVVGAMSIWRNKVSPYGEREMAIVTAFAGQAAMAINGVKLVQELQAGRAELARKVGELEALRNVGEAVSSSLDVDHVLSTIAMHAVELSGTSGGSIMEYDDSERRFAVRSVYRTSPDVVERLRGVRIDIDSTLVGRAAKERRPLAVPDLSTVDLDPHLQILFDDGWRSVVAVPMLREEQIIGSLVVRRRSTGDFTEETLDLLETFASQSALALLNAQLFTTLHERSAELEVASRHKSEFLASMSHELRTPLNAVLGFSEVLLERMFGDINERQEEYLRDIHSSGKHLLELLNEILDLSKVEAGQMELEFIPLDVPAALEYAASMLRERATAHSIELRVELGDGLGAVEADELRFKQVALNLVSNAVKFTPDGGSVVIRAVEVDTDLQVTVTDTGVGIPIEDRVRIFESFQQGGRGASREEGTGLGLTLSRRIVELFGGRMWLVSEVGVGSTFGFSIPTRRESGQIQPEWQAQAATSIVVIEDDRASSDLLTAYLSGAALRVTTVRDGQSGLDAVRRDRPSAVLLDIRLPGVDGWAVLQELQSDAATKDIPVIVVSIVDERSRGAALGAAAYLVKPVSRDDLLSALAVVGIPVPTAGAPNVGEAP
jgi:signal transduction histidine kinase/ActR/RegA family two-component response regulator